MVHPSTTPPVAVKAKVELFTAVRVSALATQLQAAHTTAYDDYQHHVGDYQAESGREGGSISSPFREDGVKPREAMHHIRSRKDEQRPSQYAGHHTCAQFHSRT